MPQPLTGCAVWVKSWNRDGHIIQRFTLPREGDQITVEDSAGNTYNTTLEDVHILEPLPLTNNQQQVKLGHAYLRYGFLSPARR